MIFWSLRIGIVLSVWFSDRKRYVPPPSICSRHYVDPRAAHLNAQKTAGPAVFCVSVEFRDFSSG